VDDEAEDAGEDERIAPSDRAAQDRRRMPAADHERDAGQREREHQERGVRGPQTRTPPDDERREERRERDDQRRALRAGVSESGIGEEVEPGEAERAEPEEAEAAAVEAERAPALDHREHAEPDRHGEGVADRGEREGVDAAERGLADHELAAPRDRRSRGEERSDCRPATAHRLPRPGTISTSIEMNDEPRAFISTVIENELTDVLQALGDPVRLAIVRELAASEPEPRACGTFRLGVSNSTLTHHFKVLREAGVIETRPEGHLRLN